MLGLSLATYFDLSIQRNKYMIFSLHWRPCNNSSHVTAPYKLSFYYYYYRLIYLLYVEV